MKEQGVQKEAGKENLGVQHEGCVFRDEGFKENGDQSDGSLYGTNEVNMFFSPTLCYQLHRPHTLHGPTASL